MSGTGERARHVRVSLEVSPKKAFATAVDWPGWSRSGKSEELALEALAAYADRYSVVAAEAGESLDRGNSDVVERVGGAGGTEFGVPSAITDLDRRPVTVAEAERLARIVAAAWTVFDRVAARSPAELRKGPRGGGRDRDKIIAHQVEADWNYATVLGIREPQPEWNDRRAIEAVRAAILEALRPPSDGSAIAGRKWPPRYAARRIAWHALDHAWEMEDRSEPT